MTSCPECGSALEEREQAEGTCRRCVAAALRHMLSVPAAREKERGTPAVPGWTMERQIGAGGQGVVWLGFREGDDLQGAVKIFREDPGGRAVEPDALQLRWESEIAVLRGLDQPGIVKILDAGRTADGSWFLATEYVEGCDLQRLLRAQSLAPVQALEVAHKTAEALAGAHAQGVTHRDLKPANIMLGRDGAVTLVDFSLSKQSTRAVLTEVTLEGTVFGTPYYLAPECLRGTPAGPPADVYALGVLVYELLTGRPPVGRFAGVAAKTGLPADCDRLLNAMLAEVPADRPDMPSAAARLAALTKQAARQAANPNARRGKLAAVAACACALAAWGGYAMRPAVEPSSSIPAALLVNGAGFALPERATVSEPWRNSLELEFLPVPGAAAAGILMARTETPRRAWTAYTSALESAEGEQWTEEFGAAVGSRVPCQVLGTTGWTTRAGTGSSVDPGFETSPHQAVSQINYFMTQRFCAWLTWREQREGRLSPGQFYRLPTDAEWSAAAGVPPEPGASPKERHRALGDTTPPFPWGTTWPPPPGFANYAGSEVRRSTDWPSSWQHLPLENDSYPFAAVGDGTTAFGHGNGFVNLWGNVWEWCQDRMSPASGQYPLRGGSWVDGGYPLQLRRDFRFGLAASFRSSITGFRCVLVFAGK